MFGARFWIAPPRCWWRPYISYKIMAQLRTYCIFTFSTSSLNNQQMALHIMPDDYLNLDHNNTIEKLHHKTFCHNFEIDK